MSEQTLAQSEERRLADMVAAVLAAPDQNGAMLGFLVTLDDGQEPALACALFESLIWRVEVKNYWIYYRAAICYRALDRQDAAFLLYALADRMIPQCSGAYGCCTTLFSFFRLRGRAHDALDVFNDYAVRFPHKALAPVWQVLPLAEKAGQSLAPLFGDAQKTAGEAVRRTRAVVAATTWEKWTCQVYGGLPAIALAHLAENRPIPEIRVAYLPNAEVRICNDALVVVDADGGVHDDLSLHDFPMVLNQHIDRLRPDDGEIELIELESAVITADRFPGSNLCHYLLDHVTRLRLYEQAGVALADVTVIDAEPTAEFQKIVLEALGVAGYLGTGRTARVRVGHLWVSSSCRDLVHPAQMGSSWALDFLRSRLAPVPPSEKRRIYVSRRDAAVRRVTNEAEVVGLLGQYGFEVIVPGELPFREQIAAFAAASHVVGPHGAGLTNIVLCQPGTHVLEVFHPLYGTAAYPTVAHGGQLRYSALVGRDGHSSAPEFNDITRVDISRIGFGQRDIEIDLIELTRWLSDTIGDPS